MRHFFYSVLLSFFILTFSFFILNTFNISLEYVSAEEVYVESVIDGDTVRTAGGESLRLLGIDTPEIFWEENDAEYYAYQARNYTIDQLLNKNVEIEYDEEKTDRYGRRLVYIYHEGSNFNLKLLNNGYASLMITEPNTKYELEFRKAAASARKDGLGIWNKISALKDDYPNISWQDADDYVGEKVIVEGKIVDTAELENISFLNFSDNYQETLTVVIFNQNLNKFSFNPADYLKGKDLKVLGEVVIYDSAPQIVLSDPENILIKSD